MFLEMTKSLGVKEQPIPMDVKYDQLMTSSKKDEECKLTAIKPSQFVTFENIFSTV